MPAPIYSNKSFSRAPGHYPWVLVIYIFIYLFVYLSIFSVNKFILTIVNKNFLQLKSLKILLTCRSSPSEVFSQRRVFCRCAVNFRGVCLCVGVILIKLQSGFVAVALLHCCYPV